MTLNKAHRAAFWLLILLFCSTEAFADRACVQSRNRRYKADIARISLIDPNTRRPVPGYARLSSSTVIDLANLSDKKLYLKARIKRRHRCRVRSVRFNIQGQSNVTEVISKPFIFGGMKDRSYQWRPEQGVYTAYITPNRKKKGTGRSGATMAIQMTFVDSNNPLDSPLCSAGPDRLINADTNQIQLNGHCEFEDIKSVSWRRIASASNASIAGASELNPTISNLGAGTHLFELEVKYEDKTFTDQVWIASTEHKSNYNFNAQVSGPGHVVAGYPVYFDLLMNQTSGGRDFVYVTVSGLPPYSSSTLPDWDETCCSDAGQKSFGWDIRDTLLRINTNAATPPGTYFLTINVGSGGTIKTISKRLVVDRVPSALPVNRVANVPAIPYLAQWKQNMTHFGSQYCTDPSQLTNWEGNVWYYDGTRIFYQIADYTGNASWRNLCINNTLWLYRDLISDASPGIQGWRVFPHGLYRHYQQTGDTNSRNAVLKLANDSVWTGSGGAVTPAYSRETAYLLHADLFRYYLGYGYHQRFQRTVAFVLGHLDQIARSKTEAKVKPFMLGLTFEALIHYYEQSGDPRVPEAIRQAAEWLWYDSGLWNSSAGSFRYINGNFPGEDPPEPAPDLNLLIAPAYAWLYHKTGDDRYRMIADAIFAGGIARDLDGDGFYEKGACLACNGKLFSQSYRWSIDFVNWRLSPPQ